MKKFNAPLQHMHVAAPCSVDWEQMTGDEQVKFCGQCQLNVYNLSEMTEKQANKLITKTEGKICVRYYQREDGSVLTQDCPAGEKIRRRAQRIAAVITGTVVSLLSGLGLVAVANDVGPQTPTTAVTPAEPPHPTMGEMMAVPPDKPPTVLMGKPGAPTVNTPPCVLKHPKMGRYSKRQFDKKGRSTP